MAARKSPFECGHYYHLYNRGVNREVIFRAEKDYLFLLQRLRDYAQRDHVAVIAYCLMPNHYHLLLRQDGDISLSRYMQTVFNSYTKAFNAFYKRTGTLFESPFKSVIVDTEAYVLHLCRYIHRNPIDGKRPLVAELEMWPYSNYLEWIGERKGVLVDKAFISAYFDTGERYRAFVLDATSSEKMQTTLKRYFFD